MTITMGDALAATRVRLDEATSVAWTDDEIISWVNEAVAEIARRTESLETSVVVDVTAGEGTIAMPADILRVNRVEWWEDILGTVSIALEIREKFAMDSVWSAGQYSTAGSPRYICFEGYPPQLAGQIYPVPASDSWIVVKYYQAPAYTTDPSAVLAIPAGWEDLIWDYAVQAAQRRDANPAWQESRQIFEAKLQQMWNMVQVFHNQPGVMTEDPGGWDVQYRYW